MITFILRGRSWSSDRTFSMLSRTLKLRIPYDNLWSNFFLHGYSMSPYYTWLAHSILVHLASVGPTSNFLKFIETLKFQNFFMYTYGLSRFQPRMILRNHTYLKVYKCWRILPILKTSTIKCLEIFSKNILISKYFISFI